jgi:hypothetical protein
MKSKFYNIVIPSLHYLMWLILLLSIWHYAPIHEYCEEKDYVFFLSIDDALNLRKICSYYFMFSIVVILFYSSGILLLYAHNINTACFHIIAFCYALVSWFSVLYDRSYIIPCILVSALPIVCMVEKMVINWIDRINLNNYDNGK